MEEKRKILLVDNSLYVTGSLHSILQTTKQLSDRYTFVYVLPARSTVFQLVIDEGFEVISLPMLEVNKSVSVLWYLPVLFLNTFRLSRIIKQKQIDIVHINDIYNMLGVTLKILRPHQYVIYYVRLLKTSYIRQMYGVFAMLVNRYADNIVCVSSAVQNDIGNPKQSKVIYTTFIKEKLPQWDGLKHLPELSVLYLGNYMTGKGQHWAIHAIAEVIRFYPSVSLNFVGGCNDRTQEQYKNFLVTLAAKLGIAENVTFGPPTDKVEEVMKNADIVLNMSESESFSMICLEAMSYGVPLVTSDCGGPAEITDNGQYAFLVPNKDYHAAARAIIQIIETADIVSLRAERAKNYIKEKFDPAIANQDLRGIYGKTKVTIYP